MIEILDMLFRQIICAVLLERALSLLFETRVFLTLFEGLGIKEFITFGAAVVVCWYGSFDLLAVLFKMKSPTLFGIFVSGAFVAGFQTSSRKIFRDVMGFQSDAYREFFWRREKAQEQPTHSVQKHDDEDNYRERLPHKAWLRREIVKEVIQIGGAILVAALLAFFGLRK